MPKKRFGNELHPLYHRWLSTIQRCYNPNHASYKNYGGRGIAVAEELRTFADYQDYVSNLPGYDPENASLDRVDNNKGYEKGNLRWVPFSHQIANQRYSGKGKNQFTGVNWSKTHKRWVARVSLDGKCLFSKVFLTEKEALEARNTFICQNNLPHTVQTWSE